MERVLKNLKERGYSNEKLEWYVNNSNVKKIYTKEQLKELKDLWYKEQTPESVEEAMIEVAEDLKSMTKDQLDEYSINTYGIDLDKRFSKKKMLEELEAELNKE